MGALPLRIVNTNRLPMKPGFVTWIVSRVPARSLRRANFLSLTVPRPCLRSDLAGQRLPLQVTVIVAPAGTRLSTSWRKTVERPTNLKPLVTDEFTKGLTIGGEVSTANARDATAMSSDTSRTRTRKVCAPSGRPVRASELAPEHGW